MIPPLTQYPSEVEIADLLLILACVPVQANVVRRLCFERDTLRLALKRAPYEGPFKEEMGQ